MTAEADQAGVDDRLPHPYSLLITHPLLSMIPHPASLLLFLGALETGWTGGLGLGTVGTSVVKILWINYHLKHLIQPSIKID